MRATSSSATLRKTVNHLSQRTIVYLALFVGAVLVALPFFWLVRSSLMVEGDHFVWPPIIWPTNVVWRNYVDIFQISYIPLPTFFWNSIVLVTAATVGELIATSLVAFSFGRLQWKGRDLLFAVLVATLFLPSQVTIIPLFLLFRQLDWIDTLLPLIIPSWFGHAFFIFLMRQFITSIPFELDDAARIDGCNTYRIFWNIILPLAKPGLATIAIFSFQNKWNQFFEPLIYISSKEKMPLAVGVRSFQSALSLPGGTTTYNVSWSHLMAATIVMVLPIIIVFFFAQRIFIQGIVISGVKG
ncbi:MAG: carbohydrate ABC transporter permease [Caldilineaceae bacterium]|nr:carbohydrate ABC transporter permease [Caldilineaceae bacterium]